MDNISLILILFTGKVNEFSVYFYKIVDYKRGIFCYNDIINSRMILLYRGYVSWLIHF